MRLVTLLVDGRSQTGLVVGDEVADRIDPAVGPPGSMADLVDLVDLVDLGDDARPALGGAPATAARRLDLVTAALCTPVPRPPAFLGIARSYEDHIRGTGAGRPEHETWFTKLSTCAVGPGGAIEVLTAPALVDYEGELGVVIGRRCLHAPVERALEAVAGYTVVDGPPAR